MKDFLLYQNAVLIRKVDGFEQTIFFNADSGKLYYRLKIDTLWNTKHPGIYIGHDETGTHYFMHNHYQDGKPSIVTMEGFTKGLPLFPYQTNLTNPWLTIIEQGLREVMRGEAYHATNYNCQTFVNRAASNTNYSEDLNKWIERTLAGLIVVVGASALLGRRL